MVTLTEVLHAVNVLAPPHYAAAWDKVGLQIGDPESQVQSAVVTLDASEQCIAFAADRGAECIVAHHPLIWDPLKSVTTSTSSGAKVLQMLRDQISLIVAHTNWDAAPGGINDTLAQSIGLRDISPFGEASTVFQFKLLVFTPMNTSEAILNALSAAGAGRIGVYERCAFLTEGTGTFKPGQGANPVIGQVGKIEVVPEVRIEMLVKQPALSQVLRTLHEAHTYEEPAFELIPLEPAPTMPIGRVGTLEEPMDFIDFSAMCEREWQVRAMRFGPRSKEIKKVAIVGGGAGNCWQEAKASGADCFISGEFKHADIIEASQDDFCLLEAGHFATEQPGMAAMCGSLKKLIPSVTWHLYTPPTGESGRGW
jgi:dinuclear metal center YbgI/SA1388 family protein